ncbi:IS110 family transposase, partial [Frateuria sp. MAH-13]
SRRWKSALTTTSTPIPVCGGTPNWSTPSTASGQPLPLFLLALLGDVRRFKRPGQLVAYVGMNPALRESGTLKGKVRLSKTGAAPLRAKLYMPALVAVRHNPVIRAFYERLRANGKAPAWRSAPLCESSSIWSGVWFTTGRGSIHGTRLREGEQDGIYRVFGQP